MNVPLKYYDYIATYEYFLNDSEINLLHKYADQLPSINGLVGGEGLIDRSTRDSQVKWIYYSEELQWLFQKINGLISSSNDNFFHMDLLNHSELQYTTYNAPSGYYGVHVDVNMLKSIHRKISFTIQLTDEKEYQGGELLIYHHNLKSPFSASKKKGSVTAFFSSFLHEVLPVTTGMRQSLVFWASGPPLK